MGWNQAGTKLTAPISWGDISRATGVGGPNYVMSNMVVQSTIIEKFSKKKPVDLNAFGALTTAQWKQTNWGLSIPSYTSASALVAALRSGITPGAHWPYVKPTAWGRALDLDGYVTNAIVVSQWGNLGVSPSDETDLTFPFGGRLWVSDTILSAYSRLSAAYLNNSEPEPNPSGLLYPSDFGGTTLDFPEWYFGVLCIKRSIGASETPDVWAVISANKLKTYDPDDTILANVPCTQGEQAIGIGQGLFYMIPMICSRRPSGISERFFNYKTSWTNEDNGLGKLVMIDGYRLPVTMSTEAEALEITFSVTAGNPASMTVSIHNDTGAVVTILGNQMFAYLFTSYVASRRADDELVEDAAYDWVDDGTEHTTNVYNGNVLIAKYIDLFAAFRLANGGSSNIAANATVTFTVSVGASVDGYNKPFNNQSECYFCLQYSTQGTTSGRKAYLEQQ